MAQNDETYCLRGNAKLKLRFWIAVIIIIAHSGANVCNASNIPDINADSNKISEADSSKKKESNKFLIYLDVEFPQGLGAEFIYRPSDQIAITLGMLRIPDWPYVGELGWSSKVGVSIALSKRNSNEYQAAISGLFYESTYDQDNRGWISRIGIAFGSMPTSLSTFKWGLGLIGFLDSFNPFKNKTYIHGPLPIFEVSWRIY